jgi:hypothetical protein
MITVYAPVSIVGNMGIYEDPAPRGVTFQERTPVAPRSGRKPLGLHNHQGTPHTSTGRDLTKTPLSMKENIMQQPNTGGSAQSFRRALRASLSPPPADAAPQAHTKQAPVVPNVSMTERSKPNQSNFARGGVLANRTSLAGGLGPPQRVEPKTPNSLLRTEIDFEADSDMEESLLVSPPGAVWNALGAAHDPSSASSTSLLIVPPATASTIHTITSSHKKAAQLPPPQPWRSPPLQSRAVLSSTPEEEDSEPPTAVQNPTPRGGIAMDLSSMFSQEKKSPPEMMLLRLQTKTKETSTPTATKQAPAAQPSPRDNPISLDTSNIFFSLSSPPPRVWQKGLLASQCREQLVESAELNKHVTPPTTPSVVQNVEPGISNATCAEQEGVQMTANGQDDAAKNSIAVALAATETTPRGSGVFLDMTNFFGGSNITNTARVMPPPHLLERLSQKTASKKKDGDPPKLSTAQPKTSNSSRPNGHLKSGSIRPSDQTIKSRVPPHAKKVNAAAPESKAVSRTQSIVKSQHPSASVGSSRKVATQPKTTLQSGGNRILSTLSVTTKTHRAPLLKNQKFFPGEKDTAAKRGTGKGISFDIAPPNEKCIVPKSKTSTPNKKQASTRKEKEPSIVTTREASDWAGKQCDTFVGWLNYTFHPDEDEEGASTTGLRALVMHRRLAQVRFRAAELFQTPGMRKVREAVRSEIARDRLTIRADRDLHADLSLREVATQLLLSYTTPWLRLGLEVMFGECIVLQENLGEEGVGSMVGL